MFGYTSSRVRLIDLDLALPDPWQDYRERRASERREAVEREQELLRAGEDDELARLGTLAGHEALGQSRGGCGRLVGVSLPGNLPGLFRSVHPD